MALILLTRSSTQCNAGPGHTFRDQRPVLGHTDLPHFDNTSTGSITDSWEQKDVRLRAR